MNFRPKTFIVVLALLGCVAITGCAQLLEHNSSEGIKGLLGTPLVLLFLMYVASIVNGLKQTSDASKNGIEVGFLEYWIGHPRELIATALGNLLVFLTLLSTDQLDDTAPLGLKIAAVLAIGYGINSGSDKTTKDGRSAALAGKPS